MLRCHQAVAPGQAGQRDLLVLSTSAFLTLEEFSCGLNEPSGGN